MDWLALTFSVSGVHTWLWLPPLVAFAISFFTSMVGISGAFLLLPFSNSRNWLASFEAMEKLKPLKIVPGHGQVCDLGLAQRDTRDYLRLLRGHLKKAFDGGVDLQAAINSLDQKHFAHLRNYESLKGGNASQVYLEIEAE